MKLLYSIFLVGILVLQACDENPEVPLEPEAEVFLTVGVSADYYSFDDMWVFATDETGEVLDAQSVKAGVTVTLKALSPPESFNLTVYRNHGSSSPINHAFQTYSSVVRGKEVTFGTPDFEPMPPVKGKATINIQNCNTYTTFTLSDGFAYSQFNSQDNTFIAASLDLRQETSKILISSRTATNEPIYGWVENVVDGGIYNVAFDDLTPFPKTISVPYSQSISAAIIGKNTNVSGQGYFVTNDGYSQTPGPPALATFGYMGGFDEYRFSVTTTISTATSHRITYYQKFGTTMPLEVTLPDNTLSILNPSIGNFNFTYSSAHTFMMHYWKSDAPGNIIHWQVYTDKSTAPRITELPEVFANKYPSISLSNLNYWISSFSKYEDGYTYSQYLHDVFGQGIVPDGHEYYSDSFQQK